MSTKIMSVAVQKKTLRDNASAAASSPEIAAERMAAKPVDGGRASVGRGRPRKESRGQVVSCRLPAEEVVAFDALCDQLGVKSRSDGIRAIIRMSAGFLEFGPEDAARLDGIQRELHKIGVNVNQIALAANRGRVSMVKEQWAAIDELRQRLPMLRATLSQVISERRRRGVTLYRKFVAEQQGRQIG